jgi:hypothetical protein
MKGNERSRDFLGPVWIYALAFALFFVRFGYGYALGDQDEILPYLMHVLDPGLFENDWFVQTQSAAFSVRTYFVYLLVPLSSVVTVEIGVLLVYLVLWFTTAWGAYHLILTFELPKIAAAGAVVLGIGILHKWTLGSNDLVYSMLVPEMAAWAIGLPAIRLKVLGRGTLSAILLGVSAWFQILVGILVFGILVFEHIWTLAESSDKRVGLSRAFKYSIVFIISALPVLIPIALQQLNTVDGPVEPSIFYILAPFRNPVHHMLSSFPLKSVIRFVLIAGAAVLSLRWLDRRSMVQHSGFLYRIGGLILLACLVMFVFTEWIPVLFVAKFQAYKLTVVFKLLALGLIVAVLAEMTPTAVVRALDKMLLPGKTRMTVTAVTIGICLGAWVLVPSALNSRLIGDVHSQSDLGMMEEWISENSEDGAVFAVPPSNSSFRSNARRAIVVNYMAFPYNDADMIEWYSRIQSVAPIGMVETGLNVRPALDDAFERLEARDLLSLSAKYGFDYALRRERIDDLTAVKSIGEWTLFRVR